MAIIRRAASSLAFVFTLLLTFVTAAGAYDLDSSTHISVPGDFNGDGLPDALMQPDDGTGQGGVLLQDANGNLSIVAQGWDPSYLGVDWSALDSSLTATDLNGDGKADVIVQPIQSGGTTATSVLMTDPTVQFLSVSQLIPANYLGFDWASSLRQPVTGDFDGDGHKDLIMQALHEGDSSYLVHAASNGQFSSLSQTIADGYLNRRWNADDVYLYVGDFNGDGKQDLLIQVNPGAPAAAESDYALLFADGSGQFVQVAETWNDDGLGGEWDPATHSITIQDVNGDHVMDIVVKSTNGGANYLYLGNHQNALIQPAAVWVGSQSAAWALGRQSSSTPPGSTTADTALESISVPSAGTAAAQSGYAAGSGTIRSANAVGVLQGSPGVSGGSATYSIPVAVPPGIAGMQPSIGLDYSSRGGNGEAGVGWSLGAGSQIHRCPATEAMDGYALGVRYNGAVTDRLCLDGQHLIYVSGGSGYGTNGATYRTELDSFALITEIGDISSNTSHFTVDEKGGHELRYGYGTNIGASGNAVFTPVGAPAPLVWALGMEVDQFNNSVIYYYSTFGIGEHLLTSIKYTGAGATAGNREVDFDYGTRDDPSNQYLAGGLTSQTQLLSDIVTKVNGAVVRTYSLGYQLSDTTHRSILTAAQECAGSGGSLRCLPYTAFNWHAPTLAFADPQDIDTSDFGGDDGVPISNIADQAKLTSVGDVDGDGRKEMLYFRAAGQVGDPSRAKVYFLSKTGAWTGVIINGNFSDLQSVTGADMDNDGASDLVGPYQGDVVYRKYTGSGFSIAHDLGFPYYITVDGSPYLSFVAAMDVNGDGYTDLVMLVQDGNATTHQLVVYRNNGDCNGSGCTPTFDSGVSLFSVADYVNIYGSHVPMLVKSVGDMDGNGLPDFGIKYQDSAGNTQYRTVFITRNTSTNIVPAVYNLNTYDAVLRDINGDGLPDAGATCSGNNHFCYQLNTGIAGANMFSSTITDSGTTASVPDEAIPGDYDNSGTTSYIYAHTLLADYCVDYTNVMVGGQPETVLNACANADTEPNGVARPEDLGIYQYHRVRFMPVNDGTGGVKYQPVDSNTNIVAQNGLTAAIDLQGDGLTDVISPFSNYYQLGHFNKTQAGIDAGYVHQEGMSIASNTASSADGHNAAPDIMVSAVDGFGYTATWDYYPLSSSKQYGATGYMVDLYDAPTLTDANRYAGGDYFYFNSSMYVVGDYKVSNGAGGTREHDFHYGQAIYNSQGRGFQGFRTVVDDDVASGARTVQVYHQRFPLSGQLQQSWVTQRAHTLDLVSPVMDGNAISHTVNTWGCMQKTGTPVLSVPDGQGGTIQCNTKLDAKTYVPVLFETVATSYDETSHDQLASTDTHYCAVTSGACGTGYAYDLYGNLLGSVSVTTDAYGTYTSSVANTYDTPDTVNWWLNKLLSKVTTVDADYTAGGYGNPGAVTRETDYDYYASRAVNHVYVLADGQAANKVTTQYVYALGNVTSVSVSGGSGATAVGARTTTTHYPTTGADAYYFPDSTTNALGQTTNLHADPRFGSLDAVTDPSGVETDTGYDVFGRKTSVQVGSLPAQTTQYMAADSNCDFDSGSGVAEYYTLTRQDGAPSHLVCYDMLNRALRGAVDGFESALTVYQDTQYDSRGRVTQVSEPYFAGDTPLWTVNTYESGMLGRIRTHTDTKGVTTRYRYTDLVTDITTAAAGVPERDDEEVKNSLGKLLQVTNATNVAALTATTTYNYDSDGNPIRIVAADGTEIDAHYNVLGQKTQVTDPDQGTTNYSYDVLGELRTQTDATGRVLQMSYDNLGRIQGKTSPEGATTWCYDGEVYSGTACGTATVTAAAGKLSSVHQSWDGYQEDTAYDSLGRVANVHETVDGNTYDTDTSYNAAGQVDTVAYPASVLNNPPQVSAVSTAAQYVLPNSVVNMTSGASDTDGPQSLLAQWTQTAGPSVTPSSSTAPSMHFTTTSALGSTYTFKYAADDGLSAASASGSVTVPSLPDAASVSTDNDIDRDGSYVVSWTATPVPGASVVYHLEEANSDTATGTLSAFTELTASGGQSGRTFTASHPGNSHYYYWYRVKAEDSLTGVTLGQGPYSANIFIHEVVKPGAPASISPASGSVDINHGYTISWGARTGTVQAAKVYYELYEATSSSFAGQSLIYSGANLSFLVVYKGTGNAGDYYYRVRACNSDGSITACSAYTGTSHFIVVNLPGGGGCPPPPQQCQFVLDDDGLTAIGNHSSGSFSPWEKAGDEGASDSSDSFSLGEKGGDEGASSFRHTGEGRYPAAEEAASTEALASLGMLDLPQRQTLEFVTDEPVLERRHHRGDPLFAPPIYAAGLERVPATNPTPMARFSVHYVYTESGYVKQLTSGVDANRVYWTAQDLNARGQVLTEQYGAGLTSTHSYDDASGFETGIHSVSGTSVVQDLRMDWDALGNLRQRSSTVSSGATTYDPSETFSYDVLNRLTQSQVSNDSGAQAPVTYTYDKVGSITCKSDLAATHDCSAPIYTYGGTSGGPHAVTAVGTSTYAYDGNGNMITRNGQGIVWNSDNLPTTINQDANNRSDFSYGPDKHRYKQIAKINGSTETTLYFGAQEVVSSATGIEYRHTLTAYGKPVMQMTLTSDGSGNPVEKVHYLLADHLGSVDTIVDDTGAVAPHQSFDAFGKRRDSTKWKGDPAAADLSSDRAITHRGYTSHEELDNLGGLVHANGRVFDANIGRFLSVDPVYQAPRNSQSMNPYSYVMNNPLSLVDPSGYISLSIGGPLDMDYEPITPHCDLWCDPLNMIKPRPSDKQKDRESHVGSHIAGRADGFASCTGRCEITEENVGNGAKLKQAIDDMRHLPKDASDIERAEALSNVTGLGFFRDDDGNYHFEDIPNPLTSADIEDLTSSATTAAIALSAGVLKGETLGVKDGPLENERLSEAKDKIVHERINAMRYFKDKFEERSGMADPIMGGPEYATDYSITARAYIEDRAGIDPTNGAVHFNMRTAGQDFYGGPFRYGDPGTIHTDSGPYLHTDYPYILTYGP